jgi:hypothetical protein
VNALEVIPSITHFPALYIVASIGYPHKLHQNAITAYKNISEAFDECKKIIDQLQEKINNEIERERLHRVANPNEYPNEH